MAKKKKRKGKRRTANVSPLFVLRPKLDQLLDSELVSENSVLEQKLDLLFLGIKGFDALPVFIKAYIDAPSDMQECINKILPQWLVAHDYQSALMQLFETAHLDAQSEKVALVWLEQCGVATSSLEKVAKKIDFYKTYELDNDFQGTISKKRFEESRDAYRNFEIVPYCTIGYRSGVYAQGLQKSGFKTRNLKGSVLSWAHAGGKFVDSKGKATKRVHVYGEKWNLLPEGYEGVIE